MNEIKDQEGRLKPGVRVTLNWFGSKSDEYTVKEFQPDNGPGGAYWLLDDNGQSVVALEEDIVGVVHADHRKGQEVGA